MLADASEVLSGRVMADFKRLADLVRQVNPTGLELARDEAAHRYHLKSRLQSLLIRRHGDDLVLEPAHDGTALIRHKYLGLDACHARIADLDDDARSWARMKIDVGEADPELHAGPQTDEDEPRSHDLITLGRAALRAYDYEAAREHFSQALSKSGGGRIEALALLELLVEHLAQDREALALECRLSPGAATHPEVLALLGLAAARCEERDLAIRFLTGVAGVRAAEGWLALAMSALRAANAEETERYLRELEERDPAHPELHRLRAELGKLRANARRPLEDELARTFERGDLEGAEMQARSLLGRFPESARARHILGRINEDRRREETNQLLLAAATALADGDDTGAAGHLAKARSLGAQGTAVDGLEQRVVRAHEARAQAAEAAAVAETVRLIAATEPAAGLLAYVGLAGPLRSRVRNLCDRPALAWFEELSASGKGSRAEAAVEAVLALEQALAATLRKDKDPEAVLGLLRPHEKILGDLGHARRVRDTALGELAERARSHAVAELEAAWLAFESGDVDGARRTLLSIDLKILQDGERTRIVDLRGRIDRIDERRNRAARVDERLIQGDLFGARQEIDALLPFVDDPEEASTWRARRRAITDQVQASFRVRVFDEGRSLDADDPLGRILGSFPHLDTAVTWLGPSGKLIVAQSHSRWIFVAVVSPSQGKLLRVISLMTPECLGEHIDRFLDGDRLWLIGANGWVLQMSIEQPEILAWRSLRGFLGPDDRFEGAFTLGGSRFMWMEAWHKSDFTWRIIDLDNWRLYREFEKRYDFRPLPGGHEPLVAAMDPRNGAVICNDRGATLEHFEDLGQVPALAVHSQGAGLLALTSPADEDDDEDSELTLRELRQAAPGRLLPGSHGDYASAIAVARKIVFVAYVFDRQESVLAAFDADRGLSELHRTEVTGRLALIQDSTAERVLAMAESDLGIHIVELGAEPPDLPMFSIEAHAGAFPCLAPPFLCGGATDHGPQSLNDADAAARRGEWAEVAAFLEPQSIADLAPKVAAHVLHLLGSAYLRTGHPDRARETWQEGLGYDDATFARCRLDSCLALLSPTSHGLVAKARQVIEAADRCIRRGDLEGARQVLGCRLVFAIQELQTMARFASAWLDDDEPTSGTVRLEKALVLAQFLALTEASVFSKPNLLIPGVAWDQATIDQLARRAKTWMEHEYPRS